MTGTTPAHRQNTPAHPSWRANSCQSALGTPYSEPVSEPSFHQRMTHAVEGFTPGYFALVMATGIISVGLALTGHDRLSAALAVLGVVAFALLVCLTLWRLAAYRHAVREDFMDPRRAFGFYTTIAATNVIGVRLAMDGRPQVTAGLLVVAGVLWLVLGYVIPWTAVLGPHARPIIATANGSWFIWVVASQSVAISAATLERVYDDARGLLAIVAVFSWSVGVFLYAAAGVFVAARMMLYEFRPTDLTPPYWVAMGAAAITVLAGARIVEMNQAPMVDVTRGLIAGRLGPVLGVRHVAHPGAGRGGVVAPLPAPGAAHLRSHVVEHHLPARDVRGGRHLPRPGRPPADRRRHRSHLDLGRVDRVGVDVRGDAGAPRTHRLPQPSSRRSTSLTGVGSRPSSAASGTRSRPADRGRRKEANIADSQRRSRSSSPAPGPVAQSEGSIHAPR